MPSLTDEPFGKDRWWINRNSPGTFFGITPSEETQNGDTVGGWKGPASLWAVSSFVSLAPTASRFPKAANKCFAEQDIRSPWKDTGKPWLKSDNKKSTVEWVYPLRRKTYLSTFTGVGRLGGLGFGRSRLITGGFERGTNSQLKQRCL